VKNFQEYVFDFTMEGRFLRHCAPILLISSAVASPFTIYGNATVALVDTGSRKLLVTSQHVWGEFLRLRMENSEARLVTLLEYKRGRPCWIDDDVLIDSDEQLDLAVFDARFPTESMGAKEFFCIERLPIKDPRAGQPVFCVGFPGEARRIESTDLHLDYSSFGVTVSAISDSMILLANTDPRLLRNNDGVMVPPIDMGGMSGAPAYSPDRFGTFSLAGFVRAGYDSSSDIRLSKASFLQADGKLSRPSWHPRPSG
jgi:hypothetical protein